MCSTDVKDQVQAIISQEVVSPGEKIPLALRLSGHLLLGVVRIYSRQVRYLLEDANDAVSKVRRAFRAGATADVDLPQGAHIAKESAITLRQGGEGDGERMLLFGADAHFGGEFSLHEVHMADLAMDVEAPLLGRFSSSDHSSLASPGQLYMASPADITMRPNNEENADNMMDVEYNNNNAGDNGALLGDGNAWDIEVARGGGDDEGAVPAFDVADVAFPESPAAPGPMVVVDAPEAGSIFDANREFDDGAGEERLGDISMGRMSIVVDSTPVKGAARKRKVVTLAVDTKTQQRKEDVEKRVKGGENAVSDIYRKQERATKQSRVDVELAPALMSLLNAPFQVVDEEDAAAEDEQSVQHVEFGEEAAIQLPDSQQQYAQDEPQPMDLEGDAPAPYEDDYGVMESNLNDNNVISPEVNDAQPMDVEEDVAAAPVEQQDEEQEGKLQSKRSKMFREFLNQKFQTSRVLHFDELVRAKSRVVVAGSFYELLLFKSNDIVNLKQTKPYGDIEISK